MYTCLGLKKEAKNLLAQMPHKKKKKLCFCYLLMASTLVLPSEVY